jgi:hypothetical protein
MDGASGLAVAGIDVHERIDGEATRSVLIPAWKKSEPLLDGRPDARKGNCVRDLKGAVPGAWNFKHKRATPARIAFDRWARSQPPKVVVIHVKP